MKSFKSFFPRIALCASMALGGTAAHAGVPVIDIAAIAQAILEYTSSLTQIENQMTQIQSLSQQLTQLQQQYQAITGARNLGDILNNPQLQNYVPVNAAQTMAGV